MILQEDLLALGYCAKVFETSQRVGFRLPVLSQCKQMYLSEKTGTAASSLRSAALPFWANPVDGGSKFLRNAPPNHRCTQYM